MQFQQSAASIHSLLQHELESYLESRYLGRTPLLQEALKGRLSEEGLLSQKPYLESSPVYRTLRDGIARAKIPGDVRSFLLEMARARLGVFEHPYEHQVSSLEAFFAGRDVFVSTGTGSGKTECFLWPLTGKLAKEAMQSPGTWEKRGIRTLILYPMNALVTDQLTRLRKTLGDPQGEFRRLFRQRTGGAARIPTFGMYTGRTPYPGPEPKADEDRRLQQTLSRFLPPKENAEDDEMDDDKRAEKQAYYEKLLQSGRIPAKADLAAFCEAVGEGEHTGAPDDAELVTRFEMQACCPDVLITNYSMLEYMLLRPREAGIWNSTREWLQASPENKLLFVIDEAHMYRGSSGGEVALLIRRLFHKLDIDRSRVQFILTTASMPSGTEADRAAVRRFACEFTASDSEANFVFLQGCQDNAYPENPLPIEFQRFLDLDLEALQDSARAFEALQRFWNGVTDAPRFADPASLEQWEYAHLADYAPFQKLLQACRGKASSLPEIGRAAFRGEEPVAILEAVNGLLAVAATAKDASGRCLLPARLHMLFRGIQGVFACTNPGCPKSVTDGKLTLGQIFLHDGQITCPACGGQVYELYNDRRCGALFLHGYIVDESFETSERVYLWREKGEILDGEMREILLYLPEADFNPLRVLGAGHLKPCYLDTATGFIDFKDDSKLGEPGWLPLYFSDYEKEGRPDIITFSVCPHCQRSFSGGGLTSFQTRGNDPFYNLVRAQFNAEPPAPGKEDDSRYPNQGRKVLLFSDSRQRAAKLARDMGNASDLTAARQLFALAIKRMHEDGNVEHPLSDLYGYFALEAALHHDTLFQGKDRKRFAEDSKKILRQYERSQRNGRPFKLKADQFTAPAGMNLLTLKLFCSGYNTLQATGVSWLEPTGEALEEALDLLDDEGIETTEAEFLEVFNAWASQALDQGALDPAVPDSIRYDAFRSYNSYGLKDGGKLPELIAKIMGWSKETVQSWRNVLEDTFLKKGNGGGGDFYLLPSTLAPAWEPEHVWQRCEQCTGIFPLALKGRCPACGSPSIRPLTENDKRALAFWRDPVAQAEAGAPVRMIRTEEHTAQLSHKDQRDDLWSKTEKYELLFQDLIEKDETPVDVLSSTTTMEVGIDLGSLVAVGLRNVPPMRENYQQRAGRAGRRGSPLATIVTFCEDGPYDSLYFRDPAPMLRGDPRTPWIETGSPKLVIRHIAILALEAFAAREAARGLDDWPALKFFDPAVGAFQRFKTFLEEAWPSEMDETICPAACGIAPADFAGKLVGELEKLRRKCEKHPELYENVAGGKGSQKSLLDALYEEGTIPTFSFPKDVVSTYVLGQGTGNIRYEVSRGLDVAISEYAPGRSIVIDKQTYKIGGFFTPGTLRKTTGAKPAASFIEDPNYLKRVLACKKCDWFGLPDDSASEGGRRCPFCGSTDLVEDRRMLRPWGFGPTNGKSVEEAQLVEEYSRASPPTYSTLPENDDMQPAPGAAHIRAASRANQRIVMINKGPKSLGFMVCPDCGAASPGNTPEALKGFRPPFLDRSGRIPPSCKHAGAINTSLGYDFVTDMLVLEFDTGRKTRNADESFWLWLSHASVTLAEAIRIAACKRLDIEYTELVAGSRTRKSAKGVCIDIYLYDSLSSGAGYSERIGQMLPELFDDTRTLLASCDCDSACFECLKNYRNQFAHAKLDRFEALELLAWGLNGETPAQLDLGEQERLLRMFEKILKDVGIAIAAKEDGLYLAKGKAEKKVVVYPELLGTGDDNALYLGAGAIKHAKPAVLKILLDAFGG